MEKAIFAAGCFWGIENKFSKIDGVIDTMVGYIGGNTQDPTYDNVCTNTTGHAEAVQVIFDPTIISYEGLLNVFWNIHNPTQLNRQGFDLGTQYRSAIFYLNEEQKNIAQKSKEQLETSKKYDKPIVTEITPAQVFYKAEEDHQHYYKKIGR